LYLCVNETIEKEMKNKRIINDILVVIGLSIVGMLLYSIIWAIVDEDFQQDMMDGWPLSWGMVVDYTACCLFTIIVTAHFWRSRGRTEKERDRFRMQALDNQLSPHFVFNNFSILADLIEVNQKKASDYLMNLSKVYRYTLSHLEHDTVDLQEELSFLQHYLSLLRERFGDNIQVNIAPEVAQLQGALPPCVLQLLIENAIKHNKHTPSHPLAIDVTSDGRHLRVSNNKQPITSVDSTSVGQHNIAERYRLLTNKKVQIHETDDNYCVTIPLIAKKQ